MSTTPTPWKRNKALLHSSGRLVAEFITEDDATLALHAVNNHASLVVALTQARDELARLRDIRIPPTLQSSETILQQINTALHEAHNPQT